MIHQLLASAASELIGRVLWEVVTHLAEVWFERRAAHSPDLTVDGGGHHWEQCINRARVSGPRYPGTF